MKKFYLTIFLSVCLLSAGFSQSLRDFKKKTDANAIERTAMLDLLRIDIKNEIEQDVVFVVNHFKVYGNYAWMEGTVQRKDGKALVLPVDGFDCCHVEALFKKVDNDWLLKAQGSFSTDVWYACILNSYPEANRQIFSEIVIQIQETCN